MRGLLALAFLFGVFAGCTDPGPPATPDPCLVTRADDYSCAQEPTPTDAVARPHLHDYWGGQDRVALTTVERTVGPFLCVDHASLAVLRPVDGETILQGASQVEATLTWTDPQPGNFVGATELWLKTAADSVEQRIAPTTSGQTHVLNTTDAMNDLPHQLLSAWEFHLVMYAEATTGCFRYDGTVTLTLSLVRSDEPIPLYPGHPDRWNGTAAITLFDHARQVFYYAGGPSGMCLGGPTGGECLWVPHEPANNTVVPHDAALVEVTLVQDRQAPILRLGYHGADTRTLTWLDPVADDGLTRHYTIEVGKGGDGPYARQSQWQFWVVPDGDAVYNGSYTVTAVTTKGA